MDHTLREKGLLKRYHVSKLGGGRNDPKAEYFVLRLDEGGSDPIHVRACRLAILTYADAIENHLPTLAAEIRTQYSKDNIGTGLKKLKRFIKDPKAEHLLTVDEYRSLAPREKGYCVYLQEHWPDSELRTINPVMGLSEEDRNLYLEGQRAATILV